MSPAGISAIMVLPIVGFLLGRRLDARWLIAAGLLVVAAANFWMSQMNLSISPWQVVWPRVVMIVGLSMLFAPLNVAAFLYVPRELRGAAVGLFALLRNEGGSVGTSLRPDARGAPRAVSYPAAERVAHAFPSGGERVFATGSGSSSSRGRATANLSHHMAVQALANVRQQQAASLAYFDCFWAFAVVALCLFFLVPFMKRSVAEKGAHVASE